MLRVAVLVFDNQLFNVGLQLLFVCGSGVLFDSFLVDNIIVGSMILSSCRCVMTLSFFSAYWAGSARLSPG